MQISYWHISIEYRRKRPICKNALVENALFFLLHNSVFLLLFFLLSLLFLSRSLFLVIYVHSRVSSSVVSGVHFFFAGLYSHEITPESWTWPWIRFTRVSAHITGYGHSTNRPGHHGTVVARTVGSNASCHSHSLENATQLAGTGV